MNTTTAIPAALTTVARNAAGDCTNGGISATAPRLAVVGIIRDLITNTIKALPAAYCDGSVYLHDTDATPSLPCVALRIGAVRTRPSFNLVPVDYDATTRTFTPAPGHHMDGGNWAIGSPSLAKVGNFIVGEPILGHFGAALPIHDRTE